MDLNTNLWKLYCEWLSNEYPEEVKESGSINKAVEKRKHYLEFIDAVDDSLKSSLKERKTKMKKLNKANLKAKALEYNINVQHNINMIVEFILKNGFKLKIIGDGVFELPDLSDFFWGIPYGYFPIWYVDDFWLCHRIRHKFPFLSYTFIFMRDGVVGTFTLLAEDLSFAKGIAEAKCNLLLNEIELKNKVIKNGKKKI